MNNFKNLLIAVLTGLLALSLFTQPAQSAGTNYDVRLAQYISCLDAKNNFEIANKNMLDVAGNIKACRSLLP